MATVEGMFVGGFVTDGTTIPVFLLGFVVLCWFPSVPYRFLYVFFSSVSLLTLPVWTATYVTFVVVHIPVCAFHCVLCGCVGVDVVRQSYEPPAGTASLLARIDSIAIYLDRRKCANSSKVMSRPAGPRASRWDLVTVCCKRLRWRNLVPDWYWCHHC